MKKYIFLFISLFLGILTINALPIYAIDEVNVVGINRIESTDILFGMHNDELLKSTLKDDIKDLEELNIIESGTLSSFLEFRAYRFGHDLVSKLVFSNSKAISLTVSYNNVSFYEIDFVNNDYFIKKEEPMAIKTIYGDSVSCKDIIGYTNLDEIKYQNGADISSFKGHYDLINKILFNYIHYQDEEEKNLNLNVSANSAPSIQILLNNLFDNYYIEANNYLPYNSVISQDSYKATIFVYDKNRYIKYNTIINAINKAINAPIITISKTEELTINKIKEIVEDSNDLTIPLFEILANRYSDYKDIVGEYINSYLIKDNNNIYYLLDVKINVISDDIDEPIPQAPTTNPTTIPSPITSNVTPTSSKTSNPIATSSESTTTIPNIDIPDNNEDIIELLTDEIKISYKDKIDNDFLVNNLMINSTNKINNISYETDYKNSNSIGSYKINIIIKDNKDNILEEEINLIIYDDIKPVLVLPTITTNTSEFIKLSDIQNRILAVDEIDGEISSINIKLTDIDNYQTNYNKIGTYELTAKVSDKSGNEAKASLEVIVKEAKEYKNYEENNIINITNTNKITRRDFISYLVKNNYITNSNITLESQYFNIESPDGEYELLVKAKNDEKKYTINVYNGIINRKESLITDKKDDYKIYYIIIGGASGFTLLIALLSIIMYKKKRNKE